MRWQVYCCCSWFPILITMLLTYERIATTPQGGPAWSLWGAPPPGTCNASAALAWPDCNAETVHDAMNEGCSYKLSLTVQGSSSLQGIRLCTVHIKDCHSDRAKCLYAGSEADSASASTRVHAIVIAAICSTAPPSAAVQSRPIAVWVNSRALG